MNFSWLFNMFWWRPQRKRVVRIRLQDADHEKTAVAYYKVERFRHRIRNREHGMVESKTGSIPLE